MFNDKNGRFQRDVNPSYPDQKCERVDPAKKRMLKEKFEVAKSYLGRFIGNILKHFTNQRDVQAVRNPVSDFLLLSTFMLRRFVHKLMLELSLLYLVTLFLPDCLRQKFDIDLSLSVDLQWWNFNRSNIHTFTTKPKKYFSMQWATDAFQRRLSTLSMLLKSPT